jgi:drug/metabolite transporter (DMT)-like permease
MTTAIEDQPTTGSAADPARASARPIIHIVQGAAAMSTLGASTAVSAHLTRYPVLGGQALRYLLAATLLFAVVRHRDGRQPSPTTPRHRPTLRDWLLLAALSTTGLVLFNIFVLASLRHTDAATLGSIVACSPLVLVIAGPYFTRIKRSTRLRTSLGAAGVVAVGSTMVQGFGHGTATGVLFALAVLVCEALFSLLAVPLLPRLGEFRVSAYVTALAVPILVITGLATEGRAFLRMPSTVEAAALFYLAVPLTVVAFVLWYRTLSGLGPQRAGLLIGFVPLAACASSAVLGVGVPGPGQLAGVLVVVLGVVGGLAFS